MVLPILPIPAEEDPGSQSSSNNTSALEHVPEETVVHPSGTTTSWEEIYWQVRLGPPSIPDWGSDAQHPLLCDCEVCVTYYTEITNSLMQSLPN